MEQKENNKNLANKENTPPVKKGNNKALFWILGGCLALLLIAGLAIGGLAYWSYKKVKKEIKNNQPKIEQWRSELEKMNEQAKKSGQQMKPSGESTINSEADISETAPQELPENGERQIGYIKKVYEKNGKKYLDIDYIQWLAGNAAEKAMREDGECSLKGECVVLNDYYIRNVNPLIRTFEILPDAKISMQTYSTGEAGANISWNQQISYNQFKNIFTTRAKPHLREVPYIVEIASGAITKITEQYIP